MSCCSVSLCSLIRSAASLLAISLVGFSQGMNDDYPTNIGITRGTPSVATLVVVSHVVEVLVALRFSYH